MSIKFKLLFLIFLGVNLLCYSQGSNLPKIVPPSPTAMQFQKYGDYQVSNFTGVPGISIPIYTIKEGDLEIPITLSYHASGIKPDDPDGILGAGWSLNTGGIITRTQMDKSDDINSFPTNKTFPTEAYVNNLINLYPYEISTYDYLKSIDGYDKHPDIFSFNFLGKHGKFFMKNADPNNCLLLDYEPISIKGVKENGRINSFDIIDEHGRKFKFGYGETNSVSYGSSSWRISSMESSIDPSNKITFTYLNGASEWTTKRVDLFVRDDAQSDDIIYRSDCNNQWPIEQLANYIIPYTSWSYPEINYNTLCPSSILFRNGQIKMIYDSQTKLLSRIEVYNSEQQLLKEVEFVFVKRNPQINIISRPFLKEIKFYDSRNNFINKYSFGYINEAYDMPVPSHASVDYWGYYNGTLGLTGVDELVPQFSFTFYDRMQSLNKVVGKNPRRTSEEFMKIFTLNEITYPTGGKTIFEYEANKCSGNILNYFQQDVGGLRVKRIINYENNRLANVKEYKYGNNWGAPENGQGNLDIVPSKEYFAYSQGGHILKQLQRWESFRRVFVSSDPLVDISPHGSPVVYPLVTEYVRDTNYLLSNANLGRTIYEYDYKQYQYSFSSTNGQTEDGNYAIYAPYKSLVQAHNDGKLIGLYYYNSQGKTIKSTTYDYEEVHIDTTKAFQMDRYAFYINDPCPNSIYYGSYVPDQKYSVQGSSFCAWNYGDIQIIRSVKRLKEIITYDETTTSILNDYTNNIHNQPTRTTTTNSNGQVIMKEFKYPHDFISQQPYSEMVNVRHIWSPVIEQSTYKFENNVKTFLQASKTKYKAWNNIIIAPETVQDKIWNENNTWNTRVNYHSYDDHGNLTSISKENNIKTSYLWGYNKTYPIAQVVNADAKDIFYTSFEEGDGTSADGDAKTGKKSKTGGYSKLLTSLTNGAYVLSYWQKASSNWILQIVTITVSSGTYSINLTGQVDEVRFQPDKVQMTTYTYDPLIGITSECDVNNRITYYQYDGSGRLSLVLDQDKNILKKYCYNYAGQQEGCNLYLSEIINDTYYSQNCGSQTPVAYPVTVPAGMFTSKVSQQDANNKAIQYAQQQANTANQCQNTNTLPLYYYNNNTSGYLFELYNASSGQTYFFNGSGSNGGLIGYVAPGTYEVHISMNDNFNNNTHRYSVCGLYYSSGTYSASFYNIPLATGCNTIYIDY